ncbi:MAG: hypothetical protein WCR08_08770 [Gammaproteobacteria bacterium]
MAKDKRYPLSDESGSAIMDASGAKATRRKCEADLYKARIAQQFGVQDNWIPTRISGATPFAPKAEMYDELSSAVTAIERGQASKWAFSNLISGMNAPSINVRDASIELLEVCRVELMKLDEINKDPTLSAQQKKDKIAQEKAFIFGLLGDIRNANAIEGTFKWTNDFLSSMGKKFGQSLNRTNFVRAVVGVVVCVTVSALAAAGTLGFLGVCAPYALPFVIAGVCLFAFCKLVKGVYNAWQDANQLAAKSKSELGDKVLNRAAKIDKDELSTHKKAMDAAKSVLDPSELQLKKMQEAVESFTFTNVTPALERIAVLNAENVEQGKIRDAQQAIIDGKPKAKVKALSAAQTAHKAAADKIAKNTSEITELQRKIKDEFSPRIEKEKMNIGTFKTTKIDRPKADYDAKKLKYDAAEAKAKTSQARVDKTPSSAGQKTLKERLGEATATDETEQRKGFGSV